MSFLKNITFKKVRPLLLPAFALFLIINANIEKDNNLNSKYWPTSWKDFKKSEEHNPNSNERKYEAWRQRVSVLFSKDLGTACKKSFNIAELIYQYKDELKLELLELKNKWGVRDRYYPWVLPSNSPEELRKKRIELIKRYGSEAKVTDLFSKAMDAWQKRNTNIAKTINRANQEFVSSSIDALRIAGYDDWQLYSRWNKSGIADLLYFYIDKHDKTRGKEGFVSFEKWLVKEGVFSKEETNNGAYTPYIGTYRLTSELERICKPWGELKDTPSTSNSYLTNGDDFGF